MRADSTKHVSEQLATVVRNLETPESVRELQLISSSLTQPNQPLEGVTSQEAERPVENVLSEQAEDMAEVAATSQEEKDDKVAEDTVTSPVDARTDDSTTEIRGSESRASDIILDIHAGCDEFDSDVEEGKLEAAAQHETVKVEQEDLPACPQVPSQPIAAAASAMTSTTASVEELKEVTVSVREDERRVELTKPLEAMTVWELIAVWNAEKSPTREFVCKLLVLLTDPTSDFAGFLQREGKRIAEHDFARQVAVQRAGTSQPIKEEPYEKQLYYTPEQRKARQKARSQQLASPSPGQIIDVDELEEGEVKSRPSSATTIMEQAAASKGDLDLRVEQARAARQQQQQLQSHHGQLSHEQQFSQSQQFPRHPQPPTFRLQQPQWRSPPRQQQQQDQRPAYQQEQRPSGYYQQKYYQKK